VIKENTENTNHKKGRDKGEEKLCENRLLS
jgi:hypothetical protein